MRHWHLFVRAEVKAPLLTRERADDFMRRAVAAAEMNVISGPHSVLGVIPGNEGVTSIVALDYSSANLHEWPGHHPWPLIHFDLYTCGPRPELMRFAALFRELDLASFDAEIIDRDALLGRPNRL